MFLTTRFFYLGGIIATLSAVGYWWTPLYFFSLAFLALLAVSTMVDGFLAFIGIQLEGSRTVAERLCNGIENQVLLHVENRSRFSVFLTLVDESPMGIEAQPIAHNRHFLSSRRKINTSYSLFPHERGMYDFGKFCAFAQTRIGLWERRYTLADETSVKVYPDFSRLKEKEMQYRRQQDLRVGKKLMRHISLSTEFEEIRDYVRGDDFRSINWKATARRNALLVNHYADERSQVIYNVIDFGRQMQHRIRGQSLIDYTVNAALQLSFSAIQNHDNAGLITFGKDLPIVLPPRKDSKHMLQLQEQLYNLRSVYAESDFSLLATTIENKASRHSLMVLYTDFYTHDALLRQLPHLRRIATRHALVVVFFDDETLAHNVANPPRDTNAVSHIVHALATDLMLQKRLIIDTLRRSGIHALLTSPQHLTGNVVRQYFAMKKMQAW